MEGHVVHLVTLAGNSELGIAHLLLQASFVVKLVLILLAIASIMCWWVIFTKWRELSRAEQDTKGFLELFWGTPHIQQAYEQSDQFQRSPVVNCFQKAFIELNKVKEARTRHGGEASGDIDNVHRALKREQGVQMAHLSERTSLLATIASAGPFVGLFGTVWGIMDAFLNIAKEGNATLTTVAPPIAEALVATAIGLVAAIPAVIAYNVFYNKLRSLDTEIDTFSNDFLNIIKRHLG
jgi:biopolymer transport protein TolQ